MSLRRRFSMIESALRRLSMPMCAKKTLGVAKSTDFGRVPPRTSAVIDIMAAESGRRANLLASGS
jgi:hypothetical protein